MPADTNTDWWEFCSSAPADDDGDPQPRIQRSKQGTAAVEVGHTSCGEGDVLRRLVVAVCRRSLSCTAPCVYALWNFVVLVHVVQLMGKT